MISPGFRPRRGLLWRLRLIILRGVLQRIARRLSRLLQNLEQALGAENLGLRKIVDKSVKAVSRGHRHLLLDILARATIPCSRTPPRLTLLAARSVCLLLAWE